MLQGYSHRTAQGRRDLRRYSILWEGEEALGRFPGALSSFNLETSSNGDSATSLGGCFSKGLFLLQELLFYVDTNPSQCYLYCCSLPSSRGSLWAEILYPLCISALNTGIMWWIVCSPGRNDPTAPVFLTAQVLQPFDHPCPSFGPSPVCKSSRGEQSTAGRTIVQLQWKHKFMLSECNLGCCWKSSGDVWRKQEWKWKGIIKINKNKKKLKWKRERKKIIPNDTFLPSVSVSGALLQLAPEKQEQFFLQWGLYLLCYSVLHFSGCVQTQWLFCKSSGFPSFQKGLMAQCLVFSFP